MAPTTMRAPRTSRPCEIGGNREGSTTPSVNKVVGGVLVMVAFAVLGQGCCGRRRPARDPASLSDPGPQTAPATTPTTN